MSVKDKLQKVKKARKGFFKGFKDFITRGNVIDLAVGVIIGAAFGKITTSLVNDVFMPLIARLFGKVSFTDFFSVLGASVTAEGVSLYSMTLADAKVAAAALGSTIVAWGNFIQTIVDFLIVSFFIYLFVIVLIKGSIKRAQEKKEAEEKAAKLAEEAAKPKEPEKPVAPVIPEDIKLLTEIRDQLKDLNKGKK